MRGPAIAVTIWMFIFMTVFGVVGYAYVLWSQYWRSVAERQHYNALLKEARIRAGSLTPDPNDPPPTLYYQPKNDLPPPEKVIYAKITRNRISDYPNDKLMSRISAYRNQLIIQLRKSQLENRNANFEKSRRNKENAYKIHFQGPRSQPTSLLFNGQSQVFSRKLLCQLKRRGWVKTLERDNSVFQKMGLSEYFPPVKLDEMYNFNSCAIVSSAGSMKHSALGKEIDLHDAVLRFNVAPSIGYEQDVGTKTTIRLLNSQVVSKPEFEFLTSPLYENMTIITWDPSEYHSSLEKWLKKPEHDLFTPYWLRRKLFPNQPFYLINPETIWEAWDFIQSNMATLVEHNPPSSGFLGLSIMLGLCDSVDVYEYVPSMRLTQQCHYYDVTNDAGCTFGQWHPLASEKLLALAMNRASDLDVFLTGKVSFPGFRKLKC